MSTIKDLLSINTGGGVTDTSSLDSKLDILLNNNVPTKPREVVVTPDNSLFLEQKNELVNKTPVDTDFKDQTYDGVIYNRLDGYARLVSPAFYDNSVHRYINMVADIVDVNGTIDLSGKGNSGSLLGSDTNDINGLNSARWGGTGFTPYYTMDSQHFTSPYMGRGGYSTSVGASSMTGIHYGAPAVYGTTSYAAIASGGSVIVIQASEIKGTGSLNVRGVRGYYGTHYVYSGGGTITLFCKKWSGTISLNVSAFNSNAEDGSIRLWKINPDNTLTLMANNENGTPGVPLTINGISYTPVNGGDFSIAF